MTEFAIRNSKHVFVEKPICIESDELTRLILALRENPLCLLSSNMVLRANPVLIDLRREMANKSLGMISHIEVGYLYGRFNKIASGWRGHSPRYSAILGGGIHMLDLVTWLVKERPVSVFGIRNSVASASRGHTVDDLEVAVMKFQSGLTATVTAVMASSAPHSHTATIHGTARTFMMGPFGFQYLDSGSKAGVRISQMPRTYQRSLVATSFVVVDCAAVALAIRESIASGVEVGVRYPKL
jgi:predicted dehydrogenase